MSQIKKGPKLKICLNFFLLQYKGKKSITKISMSLKLRLRNIKCNFVVKKELTPHLKLFKQHKTNKVLRLGDKICLTVYQNSLLKVHVTGISSSSDFESVLSFFKSINIGISRMEINNTFWMIKPFIINNFYKFAIFCKNRSKTGSTVIDVSNVGLNGNGEFFNSIFLRNFDCEGTVIIHRTSILILGAKNIFAIKILKQSLENLITSYQKQHP